MGQQQLVLLILGVALVGIAIVVGISEFGSNNVQLNKDGVTSGSISVAADAHHYRIRPAEEGGRGSFAGYQIPPRLASDDYAQYALIGTPNSKELKIEGRSSFDPTWVATCTVDSAGKTSFSYTGW